MYNEIEGDLIKLSLQGEFDVITHGCNCFCRMKRGIAPQMAEAFGCDRFPLEEISTPNEYGDEIPTHNDGNINKLGQIDYQIKYLWFKHPKIKEEGVAIAMNHMTVGQPDVKKITVVNSYTQYQWGTELKPFDYEAFILCMRKINHQFRGLHIGMPMIGSHLAGGDWNLIKPIIERELKDCDVTVVIYKP